MRWKSSARSAAFSLIFFVGCAEALWGQVPLIYPRSVFNAASYTPAGLPNGAIAQGSIFSFFGSNLGPATAVSANAFPLGTSLGGVSINVVQGQKSVAVIPLYVSASQINAIMPSNAPLGTASIQVVAGNIKSNFSTVRIVPSAFGIVSVGGTGLGEGVLQNFVSQTNQPINAPTVPAKTGQVITLYGTGLGPVTFPDNVAPTAGTLPVKTEVFVGGISASILYSGRAPCCAGLDQIVFQVPNNAPNGCWVPVYVRTGGTTVSNFVTMAIDPSGNSCTTDLLPQVTDALVKGKRIAEALFTRAITHENVGVSQVVETTGDYHVYFAYQPKNELFPFNPALAFPPGGTCTAYTKYGDLIDSNGLPGMAPDTMPFDIGQSPVLTGPKGQKTLSTNFLFTNAGTLGGAISGGILTSSLFLDPGSYTMQSFGGADVGKFATTFTIPQPPTWTNRDQIDAVDRTQPLQITWSGGDSGQRVAIIGFGEDLPTNSSAAFVCIAPAGATSFTVPPDLLSNLPASRVNDPLQSKDIIYLLALSGSSVQPIQTTGIDVGLTSFFTVLGKTVFYQ